MRRTVPLLAAITLLFFPLPSNTTAAQELSEADKSAIRAVWAEFDAAAVADDFDRFLDVFAGGVVEIFQDHRSNVGKENMRTRVGSWFMNGHFPTCESRVGLVEGAGSAAVVWVTNTQVYINDRTGNETVYDHHFPSIMTKTDGGEWKILTYQFVPIEG